MPLARKLTRVLRLGRGEPACLADLQRNPSASKQVSFLLRKGRTAAQIFILMSGWACSYKQLSQGSRQIISFSLPGDIIGLGGMLMRTSDQSCAALTDAEVSCVDVGHMMDVVRKMPPVDCSIPWFSVAGPRYDY